MLRRGVASEKRLMFIAGMVGIVFLFSSISLAQTKAPIRVGTNLEVTGNAGWVGEPELRSITLLVEEINKSGGLNGRSIELVSYDNETNVEKAVNNAKKLVQRDKVVAMIGPTISAEVTACMSVTQEAKVISYCLSPSFNPNFKDSYWFAGNVDQYLTIEKFFDWFNSNGFTRIAQICSTDTTGQTWVDFSAKIVGSYPKMKLSTERFNVNDLDVTPQLTNLKASNPQVLQIISSGKSAGVVIKNYSQMGFKIPVLTGAGNLTPAFLQMIQGYEPDTLLFAGLKPVVYQEIQDKDPSKPLIMKFADGFKKKYNKEVDAGAAVAYDAARVFFEAIRAVNPVGPEDGTKLRNYIEQMKSFPGIISYYNFTPQDHRGLGKSAVVLIQGKNERFSLYEK
jgi:branched-chain amino acid transport system substrate-binding protein